MEDDSVLNCKHVKVGPGGSEWAGDIFEFLWPSIQDHIHESMQELVIIYSLLDIILALRDNLHEVNAQVQLDLI